MSPMSKNATRPVIAFNLLSSTKFYIILTYYVKQISASYISII